MIKSYLGELLNLNLEELNSPVFLLQLPHQLLAVWQLLSKGWGGRPQNRGRGA